MSSAVLEKAKLALAAVEDLEAELEELGGPIAGLIDASEADTICRFAQNAARLLRLLEKEGVIEGFVIK